ncbi:MAG: lysylphosphatidylglycerol synthase transmembrane domain-containing protein, partial [Acidobacteriota bacterium]
MSLVPKLPKRLSLALRIGVSTVLIALMLSRLELGDMRRFLVRADGLLVGLTLVMVAMDRCLMATRWMVLLEALGVHPRRLQVVKIFFLSTFFGSFLPSGIGGEAVRAISSTRLTEKGVESVASVAMDRLLGMLSMLLTALVSLAVFFRVYPHP